MVSCAQSDFSGVRECTILRGTYRRVRTIDSRSRLLRFTQFSSSFQLLSRHHGERFRKEQGREVLLDILYVRSMHGE